MVFSVLPSYIPTNLYLINAKLQIINEITKFYHSKVLLFHPILSSYNPTNTHIL
nr:MAG TPA: hypothetical protein [Caudoviricetes sp.]